MASSHSASGSNSPSNSPSNFSSDPWIAVNLSVIWPGLGQLYSRAMIKGVGFAIATAILLVYSGWSLFAAEGNTLTGLMMLGLLAVLYLFNLFDAYNTIRPLPDPDPRHIYQPKRNRWYGLFLSQILPGFGHLYFQQAVMGGLFLGIGVLTAYVANFYPMVLPIPPMIWAIACYHLYLTTHPPTPSPRTQRKPGKSRSRRTTHSTAHRNTNSATRNAAQHSSQAPPWIITTIIVGLLLTRLSVGHIPTWVNRAVLQCIVPSPSMEPTLQIDDRIFVKRDSSYQPQMGDLVVFRAPVEAIALLDAEPNTLFVKRIVGLPNQIIAIKKGQVLINQHPLAEPYIAAPPRYDWGPETIPAHHYFVLGDNRNQSADSHVWGFLPMEDILGKAYKIYWPIRRVRSLLG